MSAKSTIAGALALLAAPILVIIAALVQPTLSDDAATQLAALTDHRAAMITGVALRSIAVVLLIAGIIWLALALAPSAPRLAMAGGVLGVLGPLIVLFENGVAATAPAIVSSLDPAQATAVLDRIHSSTAIPALEPLALARDIGLALLGIAAIKAGAARWAAAAIVVGALGEGAGFATASKAIVIIAFALLFVGLLQAVRTLTARPARRPGSGRRTGRSGLVSTPARGSVTILARVGLALALPVCLVVALAGLAAPARAAATIMVGHCDEIALDAAVAQANSDNAGDMVTFGCSGTISLTSTVDVTGSMALDGSGQQVILDGQSQVGVLAVASGVTFTMTNLTVQNGSAVAGGALENSGGTVNITGSTFQKNSAEAGGALDNSGGAVNITSSTFWDNSAGTGGALNNTDGTLNIAGSTFDTNHTSDNTGGALHNRRGTVTIAGSFFRGNFAGFDASINVSGGAILNASGTISISGSTFDRNNAAAGGAIYNETSPGFATGVVNITNSSFLENRAIGGGALDVNSGTANITFSTFFQDSATSGSDLQVDFGNANIEGSILASGEATSPADNCAGRAPVDQGYNIEAGTDCGFTGTGDLQNAIPDITVGTDGSLVLAQGSAGIDAVPAALCPAADQNGNARPDLDSPAETTCDMGDVESDYPPAPVVTSSVDPSVAGQPVTFTATVTPTDGGGFVVFQDDGGHPGIPGCTAQPLTQVSGTTYSATCTTSQVGIGPGGTSVTHAITAGYSGDSNYAPTVGSLPGGQTVNPASTTTSLSSTPDPSVYGQPVTFTASVTPTDGGGTVAFYADGSTTPVSGCGSLPLAQASGSAYTATCTTTALPAGTHALSAAYSGDGTYPGSSGGLSSGQTVNQAPLTVTASSGSMIYGAPPPSITPSYAGFVNGDGPGSLSTAPTCSTTASSSSPAGTYPSSCSGAAGPNYAIGYDSGVVTVTQAATALAYTGPQSASAGTSFAPAAALSSSASACQADQPVSFTLNVNPATGATGTYSLESAATDGTGTAAGAPVSTSGWQPGAYTITVSYAGTANCGASAATQPLVVTAPGLAAAGAGSYTVPGTGTVNVDFIVAKIPHTGIYVGGISLVSDGNWRLTGTLSSYTKSSATQGTITGTGILSWWNPALNNHHGGWQLASKGVAFTTSFSATTKTSPGSFGIQISYTPAPPQPPALPNSSPITLQTGIIVMA